MYPCTWGTWKFYIVRVWIILKSTHEILDRYPVSTIHLCDWSVMILCICPCNIQMWQYNFMNVIFINTKFLYCSLVNALRSFWKLQLLQILYHHGYQHYQLCSVHTRMMPSYPLLLCSKVPTVWVVMIWQMVVSKPQQKKWVMLLAKLNDSWAEPSELITIPQSSAIFCYDWKC
jgi:hypothetical protein